MDSKALIWRTDCYRDVSTTLLRSASFHIGWIDRDIQEEEGTFNTYTSHTSVSLVLPLFIVQEAGTGPTKPQSSKNKKPGCTPIRSSQPLHRIITLVQNANVVQSQAVPHPHCCTLSRRPARCAKSTSELMDMLKAGNSYRF